MSDMEKKLLGSLIDAPCLDGTLGCKKEEEADKNQPVKIYYPPIRRALKACKSKEV